MFTRICLAACLLLGIWPARAGESSSEPARSERWFLYTNDIIEEVPLSIHVVRVERSHQDFEFCTTLGKGSTLGMAFVSEHVKSLPPECGQPLAAINGDFYEKSQKYLGRPRDVQVRFGEVISSPAGHTCFWMDADGKTTPIGLNQLREDDAAVLYTSVTGTSTRTTGGLDVILEQATNGPWL